MNTTSELTIVIPAKNEAILIPRLLTSLVMQDYQFMQSTRVYLADAGSTDGTAEIALDFTKWLDLQVIPGGLPAVGRDAGARRASSPYLLFIDADIEVRDCTLVQRALELMKRRGLHCITTSISCPEGSVWDQVLYGGNNFMQHLSRVYKPFSTGMFMLFDRSRFQELGGFHEQALYAEDYLLSQQVARRRFGIVRGHVITTNRRFKKMGHFRPALLFLNTALHAHSEGFFLRDHKYWHST